MIFYIDGVEAGRWSGERGWEEVNFQTTPGIHNFKWIYKKDYSIEDILLERRKQATTYEIHGQIGFRFTFGSIYNNVVNERF